MGIRSYSSVPSSSTQLLMGTLADFDWVGFIQPHVENALTPNHNVG